MRMCVCYFFRPNRAFPLSSSSATLLDRTSKPCTVPTMGLPPQAHTQSFENVTIVCCCL